MANELFEPEAIPSWLGRWQDRVERYFVPDDWQLTPIARRRARILCVVSAVVLVLGPFYCALFTFLGLQRSVVATLLAAIIVAASPFVLRATRSLGLAASLPPAALGIVVSVVVWDTGGVASLALCWYVTLPVGGFAFGGARAGVVWTLIAAVLIGGVQWLELQGFAPSAYPPNATFAIAAACGLTAVVVAYALAFELQNNRMLADLGMFNTELARARDEALASSQAKATFLANMSHEIRTPMNGVLGMVDLLARTQLDVQQRGYVGHVQASAESLLRVIGDVLDLSKIEAGELEFRSTPFDLRALIHDRVGLMDPVARKVGLDLVVELAPELTGWLLGDPARISQVLTNLVGNALKFTKRGRVTIRAATEESHAGHVRVRIEVEDSGPGIASDELEAIFEQFTQIDGSSTRTHGGTGLGLAISRELAERMGGSMGVGSRVGEGSCFWFELELETTPAPDGGLWAEACEASIDADLLLVEDNEVNRLVAVATLEAMGCRVEVAHDGCGAVARAQERRFDAILMDCQMPLLDGFEATAQIRASASPNANTPIIALTANAMEEDRDRCFAAGMDDYVGKPITADRLRAVLKKHLGRSGNRSDV